MNKTQNSSFRLIRKVKDEKRFDIEHFHHYSLSLNAGIHDFQLCVTDSRSSRMLLIEDFRLENIRTVNSRIRVLKALFEDHHFLTAGFWKTVKLCVKSHKFTLVPSSHFEKTAAGDYLVVNSEVHSDREDILYYKHHLSEAVNVFAADNKLVRWVKSLYPSLEVGVVHQGSALIEGIMKYNHHGREKTMFCNIDMGILHIVVVQEQRLLYYNQFVAKKSEEYLRYIMIVFKEVKLRPSVNKVLIWGYLRQRSKAMELLKKYIRHVSYAGKPTYLKFSHSFDEIPDYHYFDAYNIFLCN